MERITVENAARFVFGETSRMVVGGETGLKYLRAGVFQKPPKGTKAVAESLCAPCAHGSLKLPQKGEGVVFFS